jgi:N-acetylmuramoyl-L-alanine amidase
MFRVKKYLQNQLMKKVIGGSIGISGFVAIVIIIFILMIAAWSIAEQDNPEKREKKDTQEEINIEGQEYLKWVDVTADQLIDWMKNGSSKPNLVPGLAAPKMDGASDSSYLDGNNMEYVIKYCKQYDVNPFFLLSIAAKESSFGTAGGGGKHKAPFNIVAAARTGDFWNCTETWGDYNFCAYDSCPDLEGSCHDAALYLSSRYLHSTEELKTLKIPDIGGGFWDKGRGSASELHPEWLPKNGGVKEGSELYGKGNLPSIIGVGIIYCECFASITAEEWDQDPRSWPGSVRRTMLHGMAYCNAKTANVSGGTAMSGGTGKKTVCLDPGHSKEYPATDIDGATGLNVADNSGAAGELEAMWKLSEVLKPKLEEMGYIVIVTKTSENDNVNLRQRADKGNTADICVRLHYDDSTKAVMYPPEGGWRSPENDQNRKTTVNSTVATESKKLAEAVAGTTSDVGINGSRTDTAGTSNNNYCPPPPHQALIGSVLSAVPVICVENDINWTNTDTKRDQTAKAIADGIKTYLGDPEKPGENKEDEEEKERWTTVTLDPGGSPNCDNLTDSGLDVSQDTGFYSDELESNMRIATLVEEELVNAGYDVEITKTNVLDEVDLRERADIANKTDAWVIIRSSEDRNVVFYPPEGAHCINSSGKPVYVKSEYIDDDNINVQHESFMLANHISVYLLYRGCPEGVAADPAGRNKSTKDGNPPALVSSVLSKVPVVYVDLHPGYVSPIAGATENTQLEIAEDLSNGIYDYLGSPKKTEVKEEDTGNCGEKIVEEAVKHLGKPYVWGGRPRGEYTGADCAGFVHWCVCTAAGGGVAENPPLGESFPWSVYTQWAFVKAHPEYFEIVNAKSENDLKTGDIISRRLGGDSHAQMPHTMIYVGPKSKNEHASDKWPSTTIHSGGTEEAVCLKEFDFNSDYYQKCVYYRLKGDAEGIKCGSCSSSTTDSASLYKNGMVSPLPDSIKKFSPQTESGYQSGQFYPNDYPYFGAARKNDRRHPAIDIFPSGGEGVPVKAIWEGDVCKTGPFYNYDSHVIIKHGDFNLAYCEIDIASGIGAGTHVTAGQVIGYVGTTTNNPQVHFEMYPPGIETDQNQCWHGSGAYPSDKIIDPTGLFLKFYPGG